jgi:RNA polymerase sigma factor (sigma-70 family)
VVGDCNVGVAGDIYVLVDAEARFRELFDATYPAVARYVRHRGLSGADAEDLVATTYEVAWRRLDSVPAGELALPWLLTVALNQLRNRHRKLIRERALLERLPAPANVTPPAELPDFGWREIRAALDGLPAPDKELLLLVAWDGLSPAQAGSVLGLKPTAARSRLHRARARLAERLDIDRRQQSRSPTGQQPDHRTSLERSGV